MVGFFFQAEDGIRDLVRSRGVGDVYKRRRLRFALLLPFVLSFLMTVRAEPVEA